MKLRITFTLFVLSFCVIQILNAQQKISSKTDGSIKDTSQTLVAHWKKGETKTYAITHTKVKSEDGGKSDSTSLKYWATIRVTDSTNDGYRLQWNYIMPPSSLNIPHANEIYQFYKGLNILFEASASGEFTGVTNWQELRDHYVKMFELSLPKKNDAKVDSVVEKVKQMFNSKPMVEGTMAREIMLLLQSHGGTYSTKKYGEYVSS